MAIDKISALARTALFSELKENELRALADRAVEQRLASGEILFLAGDEARGLYVIAEGAVRAAEWLEGRRGVFTFEDVLFDPTEEAVR